jgi:hypothetical protein
MKRVPIVISILVSLLLIGAEAKTKKTKKDDGKTTIKCPTQKQLKDGIKACPDTGCGNVDPLLNKQKNIDTGNPDSAESKDFSYLFGLPNKVKGYKKIGSDREPLRDEGEGKMIRVVAWALDSRTQRSEHGESCNCGLNVPINTDVHIVLVDDDTLKLKAKATPAQPPSEKHPKGVKAKTAAYNTLKKREKFSITAEFTPRVRRSRHEKFDGDALKALINPAKGGRLLVRVTGLQMYDSEHAVGPNKLLRHNDWEIHPVFRLEYCPKGKDCPKEGDTNWIDFNGPPN